ncbi:MAG: hypothetical protein HC930_01120 [Hydrococcus sp. SU_1_0]|nr:hypothetical protein [Hydrococcus sp. SU_1_0]
MGVKQFKLLLFGACIGIQKQSENSAKLLDVSVMPKPEADTFKKFIQHKNSLLNLTTNFLAEAIKEGLMSKTQLETLMNALADSISYS